MDDAPKSAYEIAMAKLKQQDRDKGEAAPASLTDDQKRQIAEIRRKCEARIAEREILFRGERARAAADPEGAAKLEQVEKEYAFDRTRFEAERERDITAVRASTVRGGDPRPAGGASRKAGRGGGPGGRKDDSKQGG